jgi:transcriptional regulator with PAS, ATPase and Fis domain
MWQVRIEDPSGETRICSLKKPTLRVGRGSDCEIQLRDPLVPSEAALIWQTPPAYSSKPQPRNTSPYWIRALDSEQTLMLGDLPFRESQLPHGMILTVGESRLVLERAEEHLALPDQPRNIRHWLTCSESGRKLLWTAKKVAGTPLALYLAGETGTGKEVIAQLLHSWSDRARAPFIPLHCGALPVSLAESELFGHVKGAFTGAIQQRPGALMQAHGGTLFLDEVGDLPLDIQVKLLRFLENGEIRPVGADHSTRVDVRLICATHHPLRQLVEEGKFRRDLYFRIASVTLEIPSLRSRPDDIEMLSSQFAAELGKTISHRAMLRLQAHGWPGNVRELRHAIERASGLAGTFNTLLTEESFDFLLTEDSVHQAPELEIGCGLLTLDEMERHMILKALKLANGHRGMAAKILGIARSTLFEKLKRHNILGPRSSQVVLFQSQNYSTTRSPNHASSIRAPEYSRASH